MQPRICSDYKKFVFLNQNTSFFCAKVSCPCVGSFSVVVLSFFMSCHPLHILKLPLRLFPWFFRSGFILLIVVRIHITYPTFTLVHHLLSLFLLHSTLILFTFLLYPSSSECFSFQIPFLQLSHSLDSLWTLLLTFRIEWDFPFSLIPPSWSSWDNYHLTSHT